MRAIDGRENECRQRVHSIIYPDTVRLAASVGCRCRSPERRAIFAVAYIIQTPDTRALRCICFGVGPFQHLSGSLLRVRVVCWFVLELLQQLTASSVEMFVQRVMIGYALVLVRLLFLVFRCFFSLKACGGAKGMAGFPQAAHPVRASWVRKNDDADVDAAGHAQPCAGQPELLELYRSQPDSAGEACGLEGFEPGFVFQVCACFFNNISLLLRTGHQTHIPQKVLCCGWEVVFECSAWRPSLKQAATDLLSNTEHHRCQPRNASTDTWVCFEQIVLPSSTKKHEFVLVQISTSKSVDNGHLPCCVCLCSV